MIPFQADLHCHTTCSDGTLTPSEIVLLAKKIGLSGLSITDHDSIEAYATALPLAKEVGIEMFSGAEFSTTLKEVSVHILAYGFSLQNPLIQQLCDAHNIRREERNRTILHNLSKHHMHITEAELMSSATNDGTRKKVTIGRPHIAMAMMKKGYVKNIREAFDKYLGENRNCYAPGEPITTEDTLEILHRANSLVVIAHPHLIYHSATVQQLLTLNFDGIEGYYARFNNDQNKRWLKVAKKKNWLITGGSDFHGENKPNIPLGCSWVSEETFKTIQERYKSNQ